MRMSGTGSSKDNYPLKFETFEQRREDSRIKDDGTERVFTEDGGFTDEFLKYIGGAGE
jgi:hypothetical protein